MWALSKMLHCGPWPYGYKSCLSKLAVCSTTWSSGISPEPNNSVRIRVCVCVRKSKINFRFSSYCHSLSMLLFVETGISYSWVTNCTSEKKCEKMFAWMPKKKRESIKRVTGYLQDALSIVTAYTRIGSRCKVNSIFQSESELSIHSLLSHYWVIYWMSALHTRPVLQNTLSHPRAHVSLLRKLNEWFISGGA